MLERKRVSYGVLMLFVIIGASTMGYFFFNSLRAVLPISYQPRLTDEQKLQTLQTLHASSENAPSSSASKTAVVNSLNTSAPQSAQTTAMPREASKSANDVDAENAEKLKVLRSLNAH